MLDMSQIIGVHLHCTFTSIKRNVIGLEVRSVLLKRFDTEERQVHPSISETSRLT